MEPERRKGLVTALYLACKAVLLILIALTYFTLLIINPSFYVNNLYVPALNKFTNSTSGRNVIFVDLMIKNIMPNIGVRYAAVNMTFSYKNMVLGTCSVPGFYQGMDKKAQRREVAVVTSSLPWKEAAIEALSGGSTAEFRVDVATDVKFKNTLWYFKDKKVTAGGNVGVDDSGKKVGKKSVEVKPGELPPSLLIILLWFVGFLFLMVVCSVVGAYGAVCLFHIIDDLES